MLPPCSCDASIIDPSVHAPTCAITDALYRERFELRPRRRVPSGRAA